MGLFSKKEASIKVSNTNVETLISDFNNNITNAIKNIAAENMIYVSPNAATRQINIKNITENELTKNLKKLTALIIDNDFINQIIDKFIYITETTIYSDILKFLDIDVINSIEEKLNKIKEIQKMDLDVNKYVKEFGDKIYTNILKKIHLILEKQDIKNKIISYFHIIEQFNFILINTVKYLKDTGSPITKELFINKKINIDYLYDFDNTVKLIIEKLTKDIEIKDIINILFKDLNIEEITENNESVISLTEADELSIEKEGLISEEKKEISELDIESQEVKPEGNVSTFKKTLKSKSTYAIIGTLTVLSLGAFYGAYYVYSQYM